MQLTLPKVRETIRSTGLILLTNSTFSEIVIIVILVFLALWSALPFRSFSLTQQSVLTFSWDTALHTLVALDLADSIRRLDIVQIFITIFDHHWWPPFYGVLLSPFFLFLGRSLDNAGLVSFLAYIAMPATAWIVVQHIFRSKALPWWTFFAIALLFVRSPMLLEMSAWSMFEMVGGFLGLLGWLAFVHRERARYARAAYLVGTLLYFTKYHYGFFLISTFFVFTLFEETSDTRQRLWLTVRPYLISKPARILGCTALFFIVVRVIFEWQGFQKSEIEYIPTVPNVLYTILIITVVLCFYKNSHVASIWQALPPRLRDFWYCTIMPILFWLLIPGNLRAWYRQTLQASQHKAYFFQKTYAVYTFFRDEYIFTVPALLFLVVGLFLAICTCRKNKILCGMVAYSLWPILLMSLNTFPLEARFLGCLFPTLIVTSICGWVQFLAYRLSIGFRLAASGVLVFIGLLSLSEAQQWHQTMQQRAKYRYQYSQEDTKFMAAIIAQSTAQSPTLISLPEGVWVSPTIRLALRLQHTNLSPQDIIVDNKPLKQLLRENKRLTSTSLIIGCEKSPANLAILQESFAGKRLQFAPGPELPLAKSHLREMIFTKL